MKLKSPRRSGLELLRIIAMVMIVAAHLSQRGNWAWLNTGSELTPNQFFMNIIICFGQVGVAIFFAITGYFLYNSKTYNWKRVFKVLRPTWFYSLLFLIIAFIIGLPSANFSWPLNSSIAHSLFPITTNAYWFISTYVALYLLFPYLKIWLDNLNTKKLLRLILILAGLFIIPNLISYIFADVSSFIFSIPAALFYAIVGYAAHRYEKQLLIIKNSRLILINLSGIAIYTLSSIIIHLATTRLGYHNINNNILIDTMSLPCMLTSVPLVIIFSRMRFINRFINYLASLVFGVYLIHSNTFFIEYVWQQHDLLRTAAASSYSPLHFLLYFSITFLLVFFGCVIVEAIRNLIVTVIFKHLPHKLT